MLKILDILIPRFITERVAIVDKGEGNYQILCSEKDLNDDDIYDGIATVKSFNLFGFGLFAKYVETADERPRR